MPKRASTAAETDSPASKRAKPGFSSTTNSLKKSQNKQPVSTAAQVDSEGNKFWELSSGGTRRATVGDFKGNMMVHIREYYDKDGEKAPGKKGISLPVDQFSALLEVLPQIEEALREKGETVPRPSYDGAAPAITKEEEQEDEQGDSAHVENNDEEMEEETKEETKATKPPKSLEPKRPMTKDAKKNYEATDDEEDGEPVSGNGASKLAKFKYG